MRVNNIQYYNNQKQSFGMKFFPTHSLNNAIYEVRDLVDSSSYSNENRKFLKTFCSSLAKIINSKKADYISVNYHKYNNKVIVYETFANVKGSNEAVTLDCSKTKNKMFCRFLRSDDGANAMKALIKYAKTIKDVKTPKLNLTDKQMRIFPYEKLMNDYENSLEKLYF